MRKNMDIVSFRPGDLLGELRKRGDDKQASITAKQMLARTVSMLKAEATKLQRDFSTPEMQIMFAALHEAPEEPGSLADRCEAAIADDFMVGEIVKRYRVDAPALRKKIRDLSPGAQFALTDGVAQFRRCRREERLGLNGFPSLATLRRLGFVRPQGPAAWGYCAVSAGDLFSEFVLRFDPVAANMPLPSEPVEELANAILALARDQDAHLKSAGNLDAFDEDFAYIYAFKLALATGLRRFQVIEDPASGGVEVVEMSIEDLARRLNDGSLGDWALAGVNAIDGSSSAALVKATKAAATPSR